MLSEEFIAIHKITGNKNKIYEDKLFDAFDLGLLSFPSAREIQNEFVKHRITKESKRDVILFCEHYPVITLGNRLLGIDGNRDLLVDLDVIKQKGIDIVETTRGGFVTFHGPGQIVIYPVISLKSIRCGVKIFISEMLEIMAYIARSFGVNGYSKLNPAGVWVDESCPRKLCSVGLKIEYGVTNHGFSFNVDNDLWPYELFVPCGLSNAHIATLSREMLFSNVQLPDEVLLRERVILKFCELFSKWLGHF